MGRMAAPRDCYIFLFYRNTGNKPQLAWTSGSDCTNCRQTLDVWHNSMEQTRADDHRLLIGRQSNGTDNDTYKRSPESEHSFNYSYYGEAEPTLLQNRCTLKHQPVDPSETQTLVDRQHVGNTQANSSTTEQLHSNRNTSKYSECVNTNQSSNSYSATSQNLPEPAHSNRPAISSSQPTS